MMKKPVAKYSVGDIVIADGERAIINKILQPPDSEMFSGTISYCVSWSTNEWGTFLESELNGVK